MQWIQDSVDRVWRWSLEMEGTVVGTCRCRLILQHVSLLVIHADLEHSTARGRQGISTEEMRDFRSKARAPGHWWNRTISVEPLVATRMQHESEIRLLW